MNHRLLGPRQLAECMRSGTKCYADQLIRDGRNPALLVLPEWWDPPQDQEKPFVPNSSEGRAKFPVAPENAPRNASVLRLVANNPPRLAWTSTQTSGPRVESYQVMRATGSGAFGVLQTYVIQRAGAPRYTQIETLAHSDNTAVDGTAYHYRIDAITGVGTIRSNVLDVTAT